MAAPVSRQECRFPISRIEFETFSAADLEEIRNHFSDSRFLRDRGCVCPHHKLGGAISEMAIVAGLVLDQRERFTANSEWERVLRRSVRISNLAEHSDC